MLMEGTLRTGDERGLLPYKIMIISIALLFEEAIQSFRLWFGLASPTSSELRLRLRECSVLATLFVNYAHSTFFIYILFIRC